jgi:hypothetical protein
MMKTQTMTSTMVKARNFRNLLGLRGPVFISLVSKSVCRAAGNGFAGREEADCLPTLNGDEETRRCVPSVVTLADDETPCLFIGQKMGATAISVLRL